MGNEIASAPGLAVLIPAYNEAQNIDRIVEQARRYLPVWVVDDGSSDDTALRAAAAGASVLSQKPNQGKGAALKLGFRRAVEAGLEAVITLDADGQHDAAEIPKFYGLYQADQADLIIGARDFSQMPLIRRFANTVGGWAFSWGLGRPVRDNQSGYRLISRRLMSAMLASPESGFEFEVEMVVVCIQRGYRLEWVPIQTIYAGEKSHIHPLHHVVNFFRMVWRARMVMKGPALKDG